MSTMTFQEAMTPLKDGEGRVKFEAGLLLRKPVRLAAVQHGCNYFEEKGWLESFFIIRGPSQDVVDLYAYLQSFEDDDEQD